MYLVVRIELEGKAISFPLGAWKDCSPKDMVRRPSYLLGPVPVRRLTTSLKLVGTGSSSSSI